MNLYEILRYLDIKYEEVNHNPIYTVEDARKEQIIKHIDGEEGKCLFLKDTKNNYYLVLLPIFKQVDLKDLRSVLNTTRMTFASESELQSILALKAGSVSPLGIINDIDNLVTVIIDEYFYGKFILMHPLVNTKTISLRCDDLIKIISYFNHQYKFYKKDLELKNRCDSINN